MKILSMKTSKNEANILSNLAFVLVDVLESCIIDRCGVDDVKLFKFFNYIKTFPSQLDMEIDDTVFNGVFQKHYQI